MIKGLNKGKIFVIIILFGIFINPASSLTADEWSDKGLAFFNLGEYDKAIEAYDRAIAIDPKFKEAWFDKGVALYRLGEYDKAIEAFNRAIAIDPSFEVAIIGRRVTIETIDRQTSTSSQTADEWLYKGYAFHNSGKYNKAIEAFDKAIAIDPKFKDAWEGKAVALNKLGEYNKAIEAYDRAIAIDPYYKKAWGGKGSVLYYLGEYKKAIEAYDRAIAIDPYYERAWLGKAVALDKLGKYNEAVEAYDRVIAIYPYYKDVWLKKGLVLYELGEYDKAIEAYDRAIALDPYFEEAKKNRELAISKVTEQKENVWIIISGVVIFTIIGIIVLGNRRKNKTANDVTEPVKAISTQNAIPDNFEERVQGGIVEHKHQRYDYWHLASRLHKKNVQLFEQINNNNAAHPVEADSVQNIVIQFFELLRLSLAWSGRFSRRQYAIVFFGMFGLNILMAIT